MPTTRTLLKSFGGGEVTPEFFGRIDDTKYQSGLAKARNFIILPHGPAANRAGTEFVREVKYNDRATRLIRFNYGIVNGIPQSFAVEVGHLYFRFHTLGATLLAGSPTAWNGATAYVLGDLVSSGGFNYYALQASTGQPPSSSPTYWYQMPADGVYEIPSPYQEDDIFNIHYVQSADVLTLVHPGYAPRELRRYGATNWQLAIIPFVSPLATPTVPTVVSGAGSGSTTYTYVTTAVDSTGLEESLPSPSASVTNDLLTTGNYNNITTAAVAGATRYNVYKKSSGLYGYIGQTDGTVFKDDNINPDISKTPPITNNPFSGVGNYPDTVSYFEQRRVFAGTDLKPQNFWMTRSGTESNMAYSIPSRDQDSIQFRVAAREASRILHIIPLTSLLMLTSSSEWAVTSQNTDVLTQASASIKPQSYIGANNVQPVVINNTAIFAAARGGHMREMAYQWQANGFITGDLSLRAPHLFDNKSIVDMSYAKAPQPIVWCISSDGRLLGLTYVPEQQVGAWHWHDTYTGNGGNMSRFESTVIVEESTDDSQYFVVQRLIDGNTVRYVERMRTRQFASQADAFFVDSGLTYEGTPVDTISGLDHLEGETVSILADGGVHARRVVQDGSVTLDYEASTIHIGLPITADLQTLPLVFDTEAYGQGRQKNVNRIWARVSQSLGIFAGPSFDDLQEAKVRDDEPYGTPPRLRDGEIEIMVPPNWDDGGQMCIRQSDPLPLTLCSMTLEVTIGG